MWIAALLATPVVQAQESWSEAQYKARIRQLEQWEGAYSLQLVYLANGNDQYAGTKTLRAQLESLPRRPGRDYALDAAFAAVDQLDGLAAEHLEDQMALRNDTTPRDGEQLRFEATYVRVFDAGLAALNLIADGDAKVLATYNIRLVRHEAPFYEHGTLGLPGPASSLHLEARQDWAARHWNEAYRILLDAQALANQTLEDDVPASGLPEVQAQFDRLKARAASLEPWMGDDSLILPVQQATRRYASWSRTGLPKLVEARDDEKDPAHYNELLDEWVATDTENMRRFLHGAEAFNEGWRLDLDGVITHNWGVVERAMASIGNKSPRLLRYEALVRVQEDYSALGVEMGTRIASGESAEAIGTDLGAQLEAIDEELEALGGPEFAEDPFVSELQELSRLTHWQLEEMMPRQLELFNEPHPRDVHQEELARINEKEREWVDSVNDAVFTASREHAELYGVKLLGEDEEREAPAAPPTSELVFPGPDSPLPDIGRAAMAAGHSFEVWTVWYEADEALVTIVESPAVQWRRVTLKQQPVIDQALADAQQIPPWMGDSTMVDAAVEALGMLSAAMTDHWPTVLVVLEEPGFRNRRASRRALGETWAVYEEATGRMDEAYERYSEAWHLDLLEAESEQGWSGQQ